ncbi:MAG: ATP-binding cassette domain-containing protein [Nitrosopumilaceae archaeon]|nr:ABC transporter ATP-binding protein [Nitrosopumilaceae archaeon]NIU00253.1 ABC transporter ATP-binding protein [Nitrosopumilaceae archaeon]NIU86665.1 ATP-binding cassette domain-containing protein [Nitrosopumilaceae archaeon]NIV65360.1 ATP-binding cassette domain-containing protein [Nitrosopumilaceae archaeon]NIX60855.1 ATP-binding cassette domain-containing protein [Nitrosopumilaceae archaeon]
MLCIEARSLYKEYDSAPAVDKIDLAIKSGQVFGFLGPNGAGKSTTIKLLTTLISPNSGNLRVLGIDALKDPLEIRKRIGVVLQQPSYEPTLSVEKSLDKYGMMWDVPISTRKDRVEQLLYDFDLADLRNKRNEDLSIGQRRRVQVAREFMHDMDLLFLDEPTLGLDPSARRNLLNYLRKKVKTGLSIFYTTHVLSEAEYLCDEIAIIHKGKIVSVSTPQQIKNSLGHEKTIHIILTDKCENLSSLLRNVSTESISVQNDRFITIKAKNSEIILMKILGILHEHRIEIESLELSHTNLEEVFLKIIENEDASHS